VEQRTPHPHGVKTVMASIIETTVPETILLSEVSPGQLVRDGEGELHIVDDEGGMVRLLTGFRTECSDIEVTPLPNSEIVSLQNDA
jgi:hypothetical protein